MSNELSAVWKERFALFDNAGGDMNSAQYKADIQKMKFFTRLKHISNIYALIFGIIYLCILGLWKKGLVLFVGALALNLILIVAEAATGIDMTTAFRCVNLAYVFSCGGIANYAYYLKEVKGLQGWNPFEGFSKKGSAQIAAM